MKGHYQNNSRLVLTQHEHWVKVKPFVKNSGKRLFATADKVCTQRSIAVEMKEI